MSKAPSLINHHSSIFAKRKAGFTLIELLVVMGIIGLLMAVVIPSFNGIGRGSSLDTSTNQLKQTLELARQWAITHRKDTAVVFPEPVHIEDSEKEDQYGYQCYAVFAGGDQISEWRYLKNGVIFDPDFDPNQNVFDNNDMYSTNFPSGMLKQSGNSDYAVLLFHPDGTVSTASAANQYPIVTLAEGWVTAGSVQLRPNGVSNVIRMRAMTANSQIYKIDINGDVISL